MESRALYIFAAMISNNTAREKRDAMQHGCGDATRSFEQQLWPNGIVPYVISSRYGTYARKMLAKAFEEFRQRTCLRFVPRKHESNYISIEPVDGCYSWVGMKGGEQTVSLVEECFNAVRYEL